MRDPLTRLTSSRCYMARQDLVKSARGKHVQPSALSYASVRLMHAMLCVLLTLPTLRSLPSMSPQSYLLVAIASLLLSERVVMDSKSTLRVVYIPDCQELVTAPERTMQHALIAAFADSPGDYNAIDRADTDAKLVKFCQEQEDDTLLFLLDNFNALPLKHTTDTTAAQVAASKLVEEVCSHHFRVAVTSINDSNRQHLLQFNSASYEVYGGLTEVSFTLTL